MTAFKFESKASINCGNMGARANGPIPWTKVAAVAQAKVENFQKVLQFLTKSAFIRFNAWSSSLGDHEDHLKAGEPELGANLRRI